MKKHIVICALGTDRPGILRDLVKSIADLGCSVADSRVTVLGNEFVLTLLATGTWNAVAKLESQVPTIGKRLELDITARRTEARTPRQDMLPYVVDVAALDQPGILFDIADFFASRDINIDELSTWTYAANNTGAPMISISMNVSIPADLHIGRLRDDFTDFCDSLNLDATLEPARR
ncbi:glycine cleavage system protein R [Sulfurifustis variabilis]|uniref:Glycine cleavage system transcriptional repressor n=1 Tax=Sulfurifustis variabilis TaxID=1675686 RepID=A0A1B4V6J1_9GAMM|nr:ACT domain-containing protein [Sulfurifustis variabilis]BAU46874.1 glycine cleavage system protein R [Sulfurifustis variabilis]